jgi:transmembrane sensor
MTAMPAPRDQTKPDDPRAIDDTAAAWVARRDRGLTPAQQDEFFQWLAADPRHGERLARQQRGWNELAHLALWRPEHAAEPNPDLLAPPKAFPGRPAARILRWAIPLTLAAAAAVVFTFLSPRNPARLPPAATAEDGYRQRVLDDGTLVELNHGAQVTVAFAPAERRVRLERGEALFTVAKHPERPFVVEAAGVTVRAIGTAFHVRLGTGAVDVLVTEGRVQLERPAAPLPTASLVEAGQRIAMPFVGQPAGVAPVTPEEVDRALAWQPRLLEFVSTPLAAVATEFNRRNRVQLVILDEALRTLPIGASFRSDNLDGFVRLLESSFGVSAERTDDTITLRRAR